MGKVCETCGMTRWEGRNVEGYVDSLRVDLQRLRAALDSITDVLGRGIPDERKLATITRLAHEQRP